MYFVLCFLLSKSKAAFQTVKLLNRLHLVTNINPVKIEAVKLAFLLVGLLLWSGLIYLNLIIECILRHFIQTFVILIGLILMAWPK